MRQAAEKELEGRGGVSVGRIPFVVVAVCSQREMHAALQKTVRFGINAAEGREKDTVSESGEKRKLWSVLFLFLCPKMKATFRNGKVKPLKGKGKWMNE